MRLIYLSHPESAVDPAIPVPDWGLSARGIARATALALRWPYAAELWTSPEAKACDLAAIVAHHTGQTATVLPGSQEVDRSATGYVPHARHEALADQLFGAPGQSAAGWETAHAAQNRLVAALNSLPAPTTDRVLIGHGGVGTLLWCHLLGLRVARDHDQPRQGCGWVYDLRRAQPLHGWLPFEALAPNGAGC